MNRHSLRTYLNLGRQTGPPALAYIFIFLVPPAAYAKNIATYNAYITNPGSNTVSVVDTSTNSVLTTIDSANFNGPFGVAVSPNRSQVWITNNNFGGGISVIDTASNSVVRTVSLGANYNPWGLAFTPDGNSVYVALENNCTSQCPVAIVDTHNYSVDTKSIQLPGQPVGIAFTPDGQYGYVTYGNQSVAVIDVATRSHEGDITTGKAPWGVTVSPDGKTIYVVNQNSNTISYFAKGTKPGTTASSFPIGAGAGPECIAITLDGTIGYVTRNFSNGNTVQVVNVQTKTAAGYPAIAVGQNPYGVNITPDGSEAVVSTGQGLWTISTATNRVINSFGGPAGGLSFGQFIQTPRPIGYFSKTGNITGDFNGDGKPDFAVLGSTQAVIYFSDGAGNIASSHTYTYPNGWAFGNPVTTGCMLLVGDLDGDGKTDFALVASTSIYGFISNGDGTFSAQSAAMPHSWAFGTPPSAGSSPVVGDLNGDGRTDFALVYSTQVITFLSNGDGTYTAPNSTSPYYFTMPHSWAFGSPPSAAAAFVVGDLDGDGKTDFALVDGTQVFTFLSNGDETYTVPNSASPYYFTIPHGWNFGRPPSSSFTALVGDLSGDGKTDFALAGATQVFTFLSNGDGNYTVPNVSSPYYFKVPNGWNFGTPPSATHTAVFVDSMSLFILTGSSGAYTLFSNGDGTYTVYAYAL